MYMVFKLILQERKLQKIDVNCLVLITWVDSCLKWSPRQYDDIDKTHFTTDKIWAPRIETIQQGVSIKMLESVKCLVRSQGSVACPLTISPEASCFRKYTSYWPWDALECEMSFEDTKYGNKSVKTTMTSFGVFTSGYVKHVLYNLDGIEYNSKYVAFKDEHYSILIYTFHFSRRGATNLAIFIFLPSIVLAMINLAIPALSPMGKERLTLCYTSIVSHLMNGLNNYFLIPDLENPPFICQINTVSFLLAVLILINTMSIRSMLSSIKIMPPMWLIGATRFVYNSCGKYLKFNKNKEFEGYTNLKEVTKEECTDRIIIYQVLDRMYLVLSFIIYLILYVILFCMFLSVKYTKKA